MQINTAEIAIAKQPIFRPNPGIVKFYIPSLMENSSGEAKNNQPIIQRNTSIVNNDKSNINISSVTTSNYIDIYLPRELTGYIDGAFDTSGLLYMDSNTTAPTNLQLEGQLSLNLDGSTEESGGDDHSHPLKNTLMSTSQPWNFSGNIKSQNNILLSKAQPSFVNLQAQDNTIPINSKWIVIFVGGDIRYPVIIARCPDNYGL